MDFKRWLGKSTETEFILDPETFRLYEKNMDSENFPADEGDPLPPFGHWLYIADQQSDIFSDIFTGLEDHSIYWNSGKISMKNALKIGEKCKYILKIKDIDSIEDTDSSFLISFTQKVLSGKITAVEEEFQILVTENSGEHESKHRINFDPDWELEIMEEQAKKYHKLNSQIFGYPAADILSRFSDQKRRSTNHKIQGPPGMVLLLESFSENFESRKIESMEYKSFAFESDDLLKIASRDTDAYQTSMRLINSQRQVLFSVEIQWNYAW